MKKYDDQTPDKQGLYTDQQITECADQQHSLQDTTCVRIFFDRTHPQRRNDHADDRTDRRDHTDLFSAEPYVDVKKIDEWKDESPTSHETKVISSGKKEIVEYWFVECLHQ